ncbi:MAG: M20/M25/M40 family metallo-hydrolase, partial [Alphaproteobacteria bacterium]|nr:M20/M25/M40 family metallo-hydrolase [Alphaproteobacteria bacterium]
MIDEVLSFCSKLIQCKSITPEDNGALDYIDKYLSEIGFDTKILTFTSSDGKNRIKNLFAKYKSGMNSNKILGFLGHSDVVPAGDSWEVDPFGGILKDGYLYGRGVCDMKGGIAAFCVAVKNFIKQKSEYFDGNIVVMITGDEEVGSKEGIRSLIDWCIQYEFLPNDCLIGEPSSDKTVGDRIYIGHRGSINVTAKAAGKQGHVAYQGNYVNSLSNLCKY